MPIPTIVTDLNVVPDALREFYRQADSGETYVLDLEGIDDHPAVHGLKTALAKEKAERKSRGAALRRIAEAVDGVGATPTEVVELVTARLESTPAPDDGAAAGRRPPDLADPTSVVDVAALATERDKALADLSTRDGELAEARTALADLLKAGQVEKLAATAGLLPLATATEDFLEAAKRDLMLDADGALVQPQGNDKPSVPAAAWLTKLKIARPHWFDKPDGGGSSGGGRGTGGQRTVSAASGSNVIGQNLEAVARGDVRVTT